jgi:hypothetical protein
MKTYVGAAPATAGPAVGALADFAPLAPGAGPLAAGIAAGVVGSSGRGCATTMALKFAFSFEVATKHKHYERTQEQRERRG